MKIKAIFTLSLFLTFGFLLGTNARAQDAVVKGTIKVEGAKTEGFTGLKCDDIEVDVSSKEQTSPPPGYKGIWLLGKPKWERHVKAAGSWDSGLCSYKVKVVANSDFDVVLSTDVEAPCSGYNAVSSTPLQAGWFKLKKGDTKEQNFTLDSIYCIPIK